MRPKTASYRKPHRVHVAEHTTRKKDSLLAYRLSHVLARDSNALKWRPWISEAELRQEPLGMWTA
jgi:hypothetical protein